MLCRSDFPSILGGFPHSEIVGSKGIRTSPTLIAAYHVLHRLCMPRHPPIALKTLDCSHCQYPPEASLERHWQQKDQLLEICSMARLGKPIICAGLSVPCDVATSISTRPLTKGYGPFRVRLRTWNPNKSSLYDVIQNRHRTEVLCKLVFLTNDAIQSTRHQWWSWTGSNRRPPACKAGALPAELQPLIGVKTIGGPG